MRGAEIGGLQTVLGRRDGFVLEMSGLCFMLGTLKADTHGVRILFSARNTHVE